MARKFERLAHHGRLEEGKLRLDNPSWFKGMLMQFSNAPVVLTLERRVKSKSKQQTGYYWALVLPTISEHTGHSPEDLHDIFKAKFLRRKRTWRGGDIAIVHSTSSLSSNEMAEFITNVILEANELGIEVPPPDPTWSFKSD